MSDEPNLFDTAGQSLPTVEAAKLEAQPLSRVMSRVLTPFGPDDEEMELCYQHTVFCQAGLPYRDPGKDVREWKRRQGGTSLLVEAGQIADPKTGEWINAGIPFGAKPRLILAHLNAEALRQQSPVIEVEASLSAFVKRVRGFDSGREIRAFKEQLGKLSSSTIRLALTNNGGRVKQVNTQIVHAFELWLEKDARQRVLWPSTIQLSQDYFDSLQAHAVPLHEGDMAALAHSAMALDIYAWLAQRLHRIEPNKPASISWLALKEQFGAEYATLKHFKPEFRKALAQVLIRYQVARIELDPTAGLIAHHSAPPVNKRYLPVSKP